MCTCLTLNRKDGFYFGRNLDLDYHFNERVILTPRNYQFTFKSLNPLSNHYAMIGIGALIDGYPLYAEAFNEKGLCIAGLNFPDNAIYFSPKNNRINLTPYELIPYILGKCKNVEETYEIINNLNITNIEFKTGLPLSTLHFMVSDKNKSIVIEQTKDGIKVFENPVGVLTNNPTFDFHLTNLNNYLNLTNKTPVNRFSSDLNLKPFSMGMGAISLPGDASSVSRFVKTVFLKYNLPETSKCSSLLQFFHILDSVKVIEGMAISSHNLPEITIYSCCADINNLTYYYKTYNSSKLIATRMNDYDLNGNKVISLDLE